MDLAFSAGSNGYGELIDGRCLHVVLLIAIRLSVSRALSSFGFIRFLAFTVPSLDSDYGRFANQNAVEHPHQKVVRRSSDRVQQFHQRCC